MSLSDPIAVTASSPTPALSFSKVKFDGYGAEYWDTTNGYQCLINHTVDPKSGERHYLKVSQTLNATSPYTGLVSKQTASASIAVSIPAYGWNDAAKAALVKALTDTLGVITNAKFVGFQS